MQRNSLVKIIGNAKLPDNVLTLSQDLSNRFALAATENIKMHFGQSSCEMKVTIDAHLPADCIKINPSVMRNKGINHNMTYAILNNRHTIRLGPYIGISVSVEGNKSKPFGNQSYFISQLIEQAQAIGAICFAFGFKDLDLTKANIRGYTYHNQSWEKRSYPLPDVIYPRSNGGPNDYAIRQKLINRGVRFFNPPGIGKWGTYKALRKNPELVKYLPDTRPINDFNDLKEMLQKYRCVYMKPITGSQGKNIIRVNQNIRSKMYEYQYRIQQHQVNGSAASLQELEHKLRFVLNHKHYLVQQQIDLLRQDGCIMDLRVMAQKNRAGNWLVTGKVFRIGKPNSITSNISGGGKVGDVQILLNKYFPPTAVQKIIIDIDFLALETARTMESRLGPIGELGIDIGVDHKGMIWLIEANLKPARRIFSLMQDYKTRLLSVQRPIEYSVYLAGF